jgi:hypothetical protein
VIALTNWWDAALANGSRRTSVAWVAHTGDLLAGEVVDEGRADPTKLSKDGTRFIDIKIEHGTECGGQAIPTGDWRRIFCGAKGLADMLDKDRPTIGSRVAIQYGGKRQLRDYEKHIFTTVVKPPAEPAGVQVAAAEGGGKPW